MRKLLWVIVLFSSFNVWGKSTIDLNKVKPDWRRVLDGQCVCQPVAAAGGAVILTDGRKVLFITDAGKIKWQSRLRLSRTSADGDEGRRGLVPLTEGFVVAFQGWNVFGINTDGQVVWKTQLAHKVESLAVTGGGLVAGCRDDTGKTAMVMLGIRGKVRGHRDCLDTIFVQGSSASSGKCLDTLRYSATPTTATLTSEKVATDTMVAECPEGVYRGDPSAYDKIVLPKAAAEPGAYTVMTGSGYLMLFEQSWLVRAWKVGDPTATPPTDRSPSVPLSGSSSAAAPSTVAAVYRDDPSGLSPDEQQVLGRFGEYLSLLATGSRDKWRPNEYRSNLLDTCALIQGAADLELKSVSPMLARAIALETNSTTLTALFNAAAAQGYDEGELLEAIEKKARSIAADDEGALIAACDAVQSICLFMGGSARKAQAVKILTGLSNARYPVKARARARAALGVLAGAA